eukprot:NODE_3250_length_579_cov_81.477358_g2736_i0.p2 GENE.NODE_3250_length_579_cov_81.477358_g2736_i0~~NODE_3250_length_579_cov_81.477358_g2736_i0.p2  ORF type:complete len:137 (-),score=13.57 NODE_3250_length_579_cov_81.477358_g2736_i0:20-430(-)
MVQDGIDIYIYIYTIVQHRHYPSGTSNICCIDVTHTHMYIYIYKQIDPGNIVPVMCDRRSGSAVLYENQSGFAKTVDSKGQLAPTVVVVQLKSPPSHQREETLHMYGVHTMMAHARVKARNGQYTVVPPVPPCTLR